MRLSCSGHLELGNMITYSAVDREILIIRMKNFRVVKFLRFRLIREIFLTVDDYNMDKHLESS